MRTMPLALAVLTAACAPSVVDLPPSATTSGGYLDTVTISFPRPESGGVAAAAEVCAASALSNDSVIISDRLGPILASLGGPVVLARDDAAGVVIAQATGAYEDGLTASAVRFKLEVRDVGDGVRVRAFAPSQAQLYSGRAGALGWLPVHVYAGGGAREVVGVMTRAATAVGLCVSSA